MSVIRLSYLPVAHPELPAGMYTTKDDHATIGDAPLADLKDFLDREVNDKAAFKDDAQPVVVMVHGFWYDPAARVRKEQRSGNPHDLNFHFSEAPQRHWRHTASWPLGLGFKRDDAGENGLAVAFGWDSTPDALRFGGKAARVAWLKAMAATFTPPEGVAMADHLAALGKEFTAAAESLAQLGDSPAVRARGKAINAVADDAANARMPGALTLVALAGSLTAVVQTTSEAVIPVIDVVAKYTPDIYKQSYDRAPAAAKELARTLVALADHPKLKGRPIDVFCHSLGSRVVLAALKHLADDAQVKPLDRIDRVLIVGGAEYSDEALKALTAVQNVPGITPPFFYNFIGRRDRVLTHLAARNSDLVKPPKSRYPIGCFGLIERKNGMPPAVRRRDPHWLDLQLDALPLGPHPLNKWLDAKRAEDKRAWGEELAIEAGRDSPVRAELRSTHPLGVLNHWYYFTRQANMKFFAAIVRETDRGGGKWSIRKMRADGVPDHEPDFGALGE
ncbi:MAG TPA: hypothetical protein VMZ71_04750 [Gemmataceae bacterium]|nr:hypothetical protein [Gemmataceae bacterium]